MKWLVGAPQKLVAFLQGQLGDYSGKYLRKVLEANLCRINGRVERFGSAIVRGGDTVELAPKWKSLLTPKASGLETLYEEEDFKVVNKPAGWVCNSLNLVHRLDKDTTGLLIMAKNGKAKGEFRGLFERREIRKEYLALVDGVPKEREGIRESLLAKKGAYQGQTIWGSSRQGLTAVTRWRVVAKGDRAALLLCEPETGRTHQIRVHLAEMGHPILVDRQYAKVFRCPLFIQRPLLHAYRLRFSFQGRAIDVTAPLFLDMRMALMSAGFEVSQLGEFLRKEGHEDRGDDRYEDKNAEEVKEPSHLLHQSCE